MQLANFLDPPQRRAAMFPVAKASKRLCVRRPAPRQLNLPTIDEEIVDLVSEEPGDSPGATTSAGELGSSAVGPGMAAAFSDIEPGVSAVVSGSRSAPVDPVLDRAAAAAAAAFWIRRAAASAADPQCPFNDPPSNLVPASPEWSFFPNADDDAPLVRLDASKYLAEGIYRMVELADGGIVYIHVSDFEWDPDGSSVENALEKARDDYQSRTGAPDCEVSDFINTLLRTPRGPSSFGCSSLTRFLFFRIVSHPVEASQTRIPKVESRPTPRPQLELSAGIAKPLPGVLSGLCLVSFRPGFLFRWHSVPVVRRVGRVPQRAGRRHTSRRVGLHLARRLGHPQGLSPSQQPAPSAAPTLVGRAVAGVFGHCAGLFGAGVFGQCAGLFGRMAGLCTVHASILGGALSDSADGNGCILLVGSGGSVGIFAAGGNRH